MCDCGCDGIQSASTKGANGIDGKNNYELAVESGAFTGTLAEYLQWLHGADGTDIYDLAVADGFTGTEEDYLASLVGPPGAAGANGQPAYTHLIPLLAGATPLFVQPAIGQTVVVFAQNTQWLSLNVPVHLGGTPGNWYFVDQISGNALLLRNPGPADGYPSGIATNSAPGATVLDTLLTARGRDGINGTSTTGPVGPAGPDGPAVEVVSVVPFAAPGAGDPNVVLYTNNATTPATARYYSWNGSSWTISADVTPKNGSQILFLGADPNTQSSSYGNDGDMVVDTSTAGSAKMWQRTSPGTWILKGSIAGGSGTAGGDFFRVGKSSAQPIAKGTTTATTVQFAAQTGGSLFNGGSWFGNKYVAAQALTTPTTFLLELSRIYTEAGAGEAVVFTYHINLNGSSVASGTITMTTGTLDGKLSLVSYTAATMALDDEVTVTITPDVSPTVQWLVDPANVVFYNQR